MTRAPTVAAALVPVRAAVRLALGRKGGASARRPRQSTDAVDAVTRTAAHGAEGSGLAVSVVLRAGRGALMVCGQSLGRALSAALTSEPCRLGGVRWLAVCPSCGRRSADLFVAAGRLGCRVCFAVKYDSQHEDAAERARRILRGLERRAGLPIGALDSPDVGRPRRMHRRTWTRLIERARALRLRAERPTVGRGEGGGS